MDIVINDLQITNDFADYFFIEGIFDEYQNWIVLDRPGIENKLRKIISKLDGSFVGGKHNTGNDKRKKAIMKKNSLICQLDINDPRKIGTDKFDEFMFKFNLASEDLSNAEINEKRSNLRNILSRAVNEKESFLKSGIVPFFVDFEGSPTHFKIKTIADFTRDSMNNHGKRTEKNLLGKKRMIERNLELMECYSEIPTDIKFQASIYIEHSLEFSIRVAKLQDEMMKNTLLSYSSKQQLQIQSE